MDPEKPEAITDLDKQASFATYFDGIVSDQPEKIEAAHQAAVALLNGSVFLGPHLQFAAAYLQDSCDAGMAYGSAEHQGLIESALRVGLEAYGFSGLPIAREVLHRPLMLIGKDMGFARVVMTPKPERLSRFPADIRSQLHLNSLLAARSLGAHNPISNWRISVLRRRLKRLV